MCFGYKLLLLVMTWYLFSLSCSEYVEDMEDTKLQTDKTSMLLIEPLLFIDVILVLCVCPLHLM